MENHCWKRVVTLTEEHFKFGTKTPYAQCSWLSSVTEQNVMLPHLFTGEFLVSHSKTHSIHSYVLSKCLIAITAWSWFCFGTVLNMLRLSMKLSCIGLSLLHFLHCASPFWPKMNKKWKWRCFDDDFFHLCCYNFTLFMFSMLAASWGFWIVTVTFSVYFHVDSF